MPEAFYGETTQAAEAFSKHVSIAHHYRLSHLRRQHLCPVWHSSSTQYISYSSNYRRQPLSYSSGSRHTPGHGTSFGERNGFPESLYADSKQPASIQRLLKRTRKRQLEFASISDWRVWLP